MLLSNGSRAVLYDAGGKDVCVFDKEGVVMDINSETAVISASLNKKGWLTLCEQAKGYNGAVRVYNSKEPLYMNGTLVQGMCSLQPSLRTARI